ncbi:MAG TPA: hypothetical protein VD838_09045, partial [Anaeromyxobacteraceae bacterium]|nr:hypothetical protein [Anaeromyxobacteraceae bacterium]
MTLAELVDLEAQLLRDRDADPAALEARDRALAGAVDGTGRERDPHRVVGQWLARLRAAEPGRAFPGEAVARALATVRL